MKRVLLNKFLKNDQGSFGMASVQYALPGRQFIFLERKKKEKEMTILLPICMGGGRGHIGQFYPKDVTMQKTKKVVRLTLIDALMCLKT